MTQEIIKSADSHGRLSNALVDPRAYRGKAVGTSEYNVAGDDDAVGTIIFDYIVPAGAILIVTDIDAWAEVTPGIVTFAETANGLVAEVAAAANAISKAAPAAPGLQLIPTLEAPLIIDNSAGAVAVHFTAMMNADYGAGVANAVIPGPPITTDHFGAYFRGILES